MTAHDRRRSDRRASCGGPGHPAGEPGDSGNGSKPWPAGLLIVYPPSWRARYGDEIEILICDLHRGGRRSTPMAIDVLRGATAAWLSCTRGFAMSERSRGALFAVLWSWVAFAAVAAWFGHDLGIYPNRSVAPMIAANHPGVPDAYHVLLAAGVVGCAATAAAAVAFGVGVARYARAAGNRKTYYLMAVPPVVAGVWLGGLQLFPSGPVSIGGAGVAVLWLLLGVAGIAVSTQAVITITRASELSDVTWRIGSVAATVVVAAMLVATGATITWGLLLHGSQGHTVPQNGWLIVTVIMAVTTARAVIALIGSRWGGDALAEDPATA